MLKRLFITFGLGLLLLNGCGQEGGKTVKDKDSIKSFDLPKIRESGKIVALTGYNAYSYFIYRGRPMGYEYELAKRLAEHLDLDLEIKVVKDINTMIEKLNSGEGDFIAFNLTVTQKRKEKVAFTHFLNITKQVLVQRRPDNWRKMRLDQIEDHLIRTPLELAGDTAHVTRGSAYFQRLRNLSEEIGGGIHIVQADSGVTTASLISKVADGEIEYTVADENIAKLMQAHHSNLDIKTDISLPQKIAWAVRKTDTLLLGAINDWIKQMRKKPEFYAIYNKYYKNRQQFRERFASEYFSNTEGSKISRYDDLIKEYAKELGWDWRLLASVIYQESQFNPRAKSWAGAVGLMQLMPRTAESYGVRNPRSPEESIRAGVKYLKWLDNFWEQHIRDSGERIKFVLASYNIGFGHILDARKLARKYGANPNVWEGNVEEYLLKKSKPKYYNDPVVRNGYARGIETVNYVETIFDVYDHYKSLIKMNISQTGA
jgi:membrane-bound lytic murein transglycosylase F